MFQSFVKANTNYLEPLNLIGRFFLSNYSSTLLKCIMLYYGLPDFGN